MTVQGPEEPIYVPEPAPTPLPFAPPAYPPPVQQSWDSKARPWPGSRLRVPGVIAQLALLLILAADLFLAYAVWHRFQIVHDAIDKGQGTLVDIQRADDLVHSAGVGYGITYAATAIAFIVWFYRAAKSAERHNDLVMRYGPGWAVGGWFVPILSLWRPYQIAKDTLSASTLPPNARRSESSVLLRLWWMFFIAGAISARFWASDDTSLSVFYRNSKLLLTNLGLQAVAAIFAFAVVDQITRRNDNRRLALLAANRPSLR